MLEDLPTAARQCPVLLRTAFAPYDQRLAKLPACPQLQQRASSSIGTENTVRQAEPLSALLKNCTYPDNWRALNKAASNVAKPKAAISHEISEEEEEEDYKLWPVNKSDRS